MSTFSQSSKPKAILHAEYLLWAWTLWTCVYGIMQTWLEIPNTQKTLNEQVPPELQDQFQLLAPSLPSIMIKSAIAYYTLLFAVSFLVIYKIGKRKKWARSSVWVGFVLEVIFAIIWVGISLFFDTSNSLIDNLSYIPDLGLQIYALHLLYGPVGKEWFEFGPIRR